jgi:hypothetical protein
MLFVLWGFSVARVIAAAEMREVFGAEASLAFICMLGLPLAAVGAWLGRRRTTLHSTNRTSAVVLVFRRRA